MASITAFVSTRYYSIREYQIVVTHLDQAHRFQFFQMGGVDRGQFPAFGPDVSQSPTQVNCFLNAKVMERIVLVGHFAGTLRVVDEFHQARSGRFVPNEVGGTRNEEAGND